MEYKATLDLKSKIITAGVAVLFLSIIVFNIKLVSFETTDMTKAIVVTLITVLIISVFIFCYLYRPLGYIVDKDRLIVKRPIKDFVIDFSTIEEVLLPTTDSMKWTMRTFGNGGLFGYFGSYQNDTHGAMKWYATKTTNYVMIVTRANNKIVLTPDDTEMINAIKK